MIREATEADIPALMAIGEKFAAKARLAEHVGFDPASLEKTLRTMMAGEPFVLLMSDAGAIGGMLAAHPFNHARLFVDELFWWAEGGGGLALLEAFEQWAGERGALVRMTALEACEPGRVANILQRRGYQPLERAFIKVK